MKFKVNKKYIVDAKSHDEAIKIIKKLQDAMNTYEIHWIDTYSKSKGYDKSFWSFKDIVKANDVAEALKKLSGIVVMRGVGTANCLVVNVASNTATYQWSGKLSELLNKSKEQLGDCDKKVVNLDDATASGTADLTRIINEALKKASQEKNGLLHLNEKIDVNGKRVKGYLRFFWNGGPQLSFYPQSGDVVMFKGDSSIDIPYDRNSMTVKQSDINRVAGQIFEAADKINETTASLKNEKPKLVGYVLEFIEGEQSVARRQMLNKTVGFNEMVKFLKTEDDKFRASGKRGYDKAYIDAVYSLGKHKYRVHGARFDVGDGNVESTLRRELGFPEREIEKFKQSGYSTYVKQIDSVKDERVFLRYIFKNATEYGTIQKVNGKIYSTSRPGEEFASEQEALNHALRHGWKEISKVEWDKYAKRKDSVKDSDPHYIINNKVFGTLEEAKKYEKDYRSKTGVFLEIRETNRAVTHVYKDSIKDEESIFEVAQINKSPEYFNTKEELLRKYSGVDNGSQIKLKGFLGPFFNGYKSGKKVYRYETQELYNALSDSVKDGSFEFTVKYWNGPTKKENVSAPDYDSAVKLLSAKKDVLWFGANGKIYTNTNVIKSNSPYAKKDAVKDEEVDLAYLIKDEIEAINGYKAMIAKTKNPKLLDVLSHILGEEVAHVEELRNAQSGNFEIVDSVKDAYLQTPRGNFELVNESEEMLRHKGWGMWFEHIENGKFYRIMHDPKTQHAVAVFVKNVNDSFYDSVEDEISPEKQVGLKVTMRDPNYIDFTITNDNQNLYRYEKATGKMRKILGVGPNNFGNAIRGIDRKKIESVAKEVFERNLPFAIIA